MFFSADAARNNVAPSNGWFGGRRGELALVVKGNKKNGEQLVFAVLTPAEDHSNVTEFPLPCCGVTVYSNCPSFPGRRYRLHE